MSGCGIWRFWKDQDGAVTVDWVVLTAAVIGLGMVVLMPVAFATTSATNGVAAYVASVPVGFGN
jgi:Flp pilus assembly pilin Flp